MTRKDTIIIAVLVNAALLIGLFVTAIKREDSGADKAIVEIKKLELPVQIKPEIKTAQGDEIDAVLREFSKKTASQTAVETAKEDKAPPSFPSPPIDFAKELEAITKAPIASPAKITPSHRSASKDYIEVKICKGDALEKIARANKTTVSQLIELNQLKTTVLQIGQTLKIPTPMSIEAKKETQVLAPTNEDFYIVKAGDNPWSIAVKNHLKLEELLKLNHLDEQKARHLKPGDKLRIR